MISSITSTSSAGRGPSRKNAEFAPNLRISRRHERSNHEVRGCIDGGYGQSLA